MTELAALNIRITGDDADLKAALSSATGSLTAFEGRAGKAAASVGGITRAGAGMSHTLRGVSQQLSQVGQQTMATGNFVQALAIQLPDIGLAFGAIGTAAGLLAGIALPMLVSAFSGAGAVSDELKAKQEALKAALDNVTQATEDYRLERAMGESGAQTQSEQVLLNEINRIMTERIGIEAEIVALSYEEANATSLATTAELGKLAVRRQAIDAKKAELDAALAALDAERAATAEVERKRAKMQAAYEVYARTRKEADELAEAASRAGVSASDLSHISFSNISGAASEALRLAGNLGIALDTASKLAALGPQGIGGNDPSGGTYSGRGRGPTQGEIVDMRVAGQFGYTTPPSGSGGGSGGGAGGGGGVNPVIGELEALQESLMTQEAVQLESYTRQQETLRSALDQRLITQQEYAAMIEQVQSQHEQKLGEIQATAQQQRLSETAGLFGALAGIAEAGGQRMAKAVAAAQAIEGTINAYGAAIKALNTPGIGLAGRFAAYASVLAAGLKGVAAIRSAGGVAGGGGGAGASVAQAGASQGPLQVSLSTFGAGDFLARADLGGLLDNLNKTAGDRGYRIMVPA